MNKIIVFHDKNKVLTLGTALVPQRPTGARILQFRPRPWRRAPNFVLRAIWRRNPESGRLECHWVPKCGIASDNGARRRRGTLAARVVAAAPRRSPSLFR